MHFVIIDQCLNIYVTLETEVAMDAQSQSLKQPIVFDTTSGRVGDKIPQSMHILEEQGNIALQNTAALVRVWRIRTNCPKTALQCKSCPAGLNWVKCCSVLFMRSLMVGGWHTVTHCDTLCQSLDLQIKTAVQQKHDNTLVSVAGWCTSQCVAGFWMESQKKEKQYQPLWRPVKHSGKWVYLVRCTDRRCILRDQTLTRLVDGVQQ